MIKKRFLSSLLAVCVVFSMIFCTRTDVYAKSTESIKIVFDGKKAITLNSKSEPETLSQVEKKWGKKTRLAEGDEEYAGEAYVWEKGKTFISIREYKESEGSGLGYVMLEVGDKNASVAGVKVGMKRSKAVKKLQKIYGKKKVALLKDGQYAVPDGDSFTIDGKASGKSYTEISVMTKNGMPLSFSLKNDKVKKISWMRS